MNILFPLLLPQRQQPITEEQILQAFDSHGATELFHPRDVVMWKPSMQNRMFPAYGDPAVVVHHEHTGIEFDRRIREKLPPDHHWCDPRGSEYHENLDMILGSFHPDGTYYLVPIDSRRVMRYDINMARDLRKFLEEQQQRAGQDALNQTRTVIDELHRRFMGDDPSTPS